MNLNTSKRVMHTIVVLLACCAAMMAQTTEKKPIKPIRDYVVLPAQSLADVQKKLQPDNKVEELIGGAGMELRVAVQHERNTTPPTAELHDTSDDVYYVLDGTATLILGGTLDGPREVEPGEWRGPKIVNGKTIQVAKGDLIIVPRGTPHQRLTVNQDFSMILIKVYQDPRPAPKP